MVTIYVVVVGGDTKSAVMLVTPLTVNVNGSCAVVGHCPEGVHVHPLSTYPEAASAVTCTDELALYQFAPDGLTEPPLVGEATVVTSYCVPYVTDTDVCVDTERLPADGLGTYRTPQPPDNGPWT